jgi:hypothetical protein
VSPLISGETCIYALLGMMLGPAVLYVIYGACKWARENL